MDLKVKVDLQKVIDELDWLSKHNEIMRIHAVSMEQAEKLVEIGKRMYTFRREEAHNT